LHRPERRTVVTSARRVAQRELTKAPGTASGGLRAVTCGAEVVRVAQ
jgi:hypothetical protein